MELKEPSSAASSITLSKRANWQVASALEDAAEDFCYLIMRLLRLVLSLAIEIAMFVLAVPMTYAVFFAVMYAISFGTMDVSDSGANVVFAFLENHCVLSSALLVPTVLFLWVQTMAVGLPYRYSTGVPGLNTKKCWRCDAEIPDQLYCKPCGAFRFGRVLTAGIWCLSAVVTMLFVVNDALMALITIAGLSKGSK